MGINLEHIALKANELTLSRAFYHDLGAETGLSETGERLTVQFSTGPRLFFDLASTPINPAILSYIGLEMSSFNAVDAIFQQMFEKWPIRLDLRERYRTVTGPYGFFIDDPNGYSLKVFHYNQTAFI